MGREQASRETRTKPMAGSPVKALATIEKRAAILAVSSATLLAIPLFVPIAFPLAWFGLAPLMAALQSPRWQVPLTVSLIFGLVFHGFANYWLVPTIITLAPFAESTTQAMTVWAIVGFIALLLWQSLFAMIFGISLWLIGQRKGGISFALGASSAWLLTEWLRSLGLFGYPWALLASTQIAFLPVVQLVAWIGSFGLSGAIAFVNALFFEWWRQRRSRYLVSALGLISAICLLGWVEQKRVEGQMNSSPHLKVAVVQGNFGKERWRPDVTFEELEEILQTHLRLSEQAAKQGARLIVWSETALPWRLREEGRWGYGADEIQALANKHQVVLFVGAGEWREGRSYNACFVFAPKGVLKQDGVYHKIRLVPFGEYVPGRELFPWLDKILPHAPVQTTPGSRWTIPTLNFKDVKLVVVPAVAICFESLFPFHIRKLVSRQSLRTSPANLLVIITNDSWFGNTLAPYHHARAAILRAVEMRRSVARGAGTGISLIVLPNGKITQVAGWDERRILIASVPLVEKRSCYQVLGDLPFVILAAL
ncbi:MAG: apolipoprotein N-acyltransferase, partial [Armatimonadota bacterium]